jgi:Domain of unknown function (DUF1905)/Bacteriocin-protection, YdeI or OmpD-Associated
MLVNNIYQIQKQPNKGGWHYVVITEIAASEKSALGLVRVSGTVDNYELKQFNLLPMKDGNMLLPLKAALRKAIRKKEGDTVQVTLFSDETPIFVPDAILMSLLEFPRAYDFFMTLSESNKKYYIDWIEEAKRMKTKDNRIVKAIDQLEKGIKFYDWPITSY